MTELDPERFREAAGEWRDVARRTMLIKPVNAASRATLVELRDAALQAASSFDRLVELLLPHRQKP
jgi:hypothetical protein